MEVIRANNIVFNTTGKSDNATGNQKHGPYKLTKSPIAHGSQGSRNAASETPKPEDAHGTDQEPKLHPHTLQPIDGGMKVTIGSLQDGQVVSGAKPFGRPILETPLSWKKRESPADSGIEMTPMSMSPLKTNPKVSAFRLSD